MPMVPHAGLQWSDNWKKEEVRKWNSRTCFRKLLTVFENIDNIIFVVYEFTYCYLNLVFFCVFPKFSGQKRGKRTKLVLFVLVFEKKKIILKNGNQTRFLLFCCNCNFVFRPNSSPF